MDWRGETGVSEVMDEIPGEVVGFTSSFVFQKNSMLVEARPSGSTARRGGRWIGFKPCELPPSVQQ